MASDSSVLSFNTMVHMITIKLSSTNFLLWRSQVHPLLLCQDLFGYTDGSLPAPAKTISSGSNTEPNPPYNDWRKTDQCIVSLLLSSLSEEALSVVVGLTSSSAIWSALENSFSNKSKTRELCLKDDFQLIKRGSRSIPEYSRAFKTICDRLAAMGCPVDETDQVRWYLRGLGPEYSTFSTMQMSLSPLPTFRDIVP